MNMQREGRTWGGGYAQEIPKAPTLLTNAEYLDKKVDRSIMEDEYWQWIPARKKKLVVAIWKKRKLPGGRNLLYFFIFLKHMGRQIKVFKSKMGVGKENTMNKDDLV